MNIAISRKKCSAENQIAQLRKITENEKRTKILRSNSVKKSPFLVPSNTKINLFSFQTIGQWNPKILELMESKKTLKMSGYGGIKGQ